MEKRSKRNKELYKIVDKQNEDYYNRKNNTEFSETTSVLSNVNEDLFGKKDKKTKVSNKESNVNPILVFIIVVLVIILIAMVMANGK